MILTIIVSITKFLIMIGSQRAHLSHTQHVIEWVSNYWYDYNLLQVDCFGHSHIYDFLLNNYFQQWLKLKESAAHFFAQKKISKNYFDFKICY